MTSIRRPRSIHGPRMEAFEARFFNDQVLLLDYMFVHRLTGIEGKDGNPLNEVRVLCNSILPNQGKLQVDKLPGWPNSAGASIKLPPEKSVLKLRGPDSRTWGSRLLSREVNEEMHGRR